MKWRNYLIIAGISGVIGASVGYFLAQTKKPDELTFGSQVYPITYRSDYVVIGTLEQRVESLLDENPQELKRVCETIINQKRKTFLYESP